MEACSRRYRKELLGVLNVCPQEAHRHSVFAVISLASVPTFVELHDVQLGRAIASGSMFRWRGSASRMNDHVTEGSDRLLFQIEHSCPAFSSYTCFSPFCV